MDAIRVLVACWLRASLQLLRVNCRNDNPPFGAPRLLEDFQFDCVGSHLLADGVIMIGAAPNAARASLIALGVSTVVCKEKEKADFVFLRSPHA